MVSTIQVFCFTVKADGLLRSLVSSAEISQAFDPATTKSHPPIQQYAAIWDTGATNSVISRRVVQECGLAPIGMTKVRGVHGESLSEIYLVSLRLPNKVGISSIRVTVGDIAGAEILIGMDVIGLGDFAVTNKDGKTVFTFRLPSIECIDFVEQRPKPSEPSPPAQPGPKPGRNAPCPCGSGKKYKKCCGRITNLPSGSSTTA